MENKLMKGVITLLASLFTLCALSISASACYFGYYQPEEPKCLREE